MRMEAQTAVEPASFEIVFMSRSAEGSSRGLAEVNVLKK